MGNEHFVINEEEIPEGIKLLIKGRIDSGNTLELQDKLKHAVENGHLNIILNMLWVEFLCSTGIRVILKAYQEMNKAGGSFGIEMPSQHVRNILGMTALDDLLIR